MKKFLVISGIVAAVFGVITVIFGLSLWSWVGGFYDAANKGRLAAIAKDQEAQQIYDKTWRVISDKAEISAKHASDFKQMFIEGNSARYSNKENAMMLWIQEQNPTLDPSLYRELSQTVEAQRNEYASVVKAQISIAQEHNTKVTSSGSYLPCTILRIIGNPRQACDTVIVRQVTSRRTNESFKSGEDNNTGLFHNQQQVK